MSLIAASVVLAVALALIGPFAAARLFTERGGRRSAAAPLPDDLRALLGRRIPHVARLPTELRNRFEARVREFLAGKRFYGCNGLEVTDEMRALVAGLACLLVLREDARAHPKVFPGLRSILLYPTAFWVRHEQPDELGLVSDEPVEQLGESWEGQRVVLSWEDVEAALSGDPVNVVAHEFAHQLDDENPGTEGAPRLPDYERWSRVMTHEYEKFKVKRSPVLDDYGLEGPGEFFCVATEAYFQSGARLKRHHPELYELLRDYYRIETA